MNSRDKSSFGSSERKTLATRVLITGVPKVGKTAIADKVSHLIPGVTAFEFGRAMASIGLRRGIIRGYEDLVTISQGERADLQAAVAARIAKIDSPLAIAAHLVVGTPEGYVDGLPPGGIEVLQPTGIIVVTSDPRQIYLRCSSAEGQQNSWNVQDISFHQDAVRKHTAELSSKLRLPIGEVVNLDGELDQAAETAALLWRRFEAINS